MTTSPELCETEGGEDLPGPFDIRSYDGLLQFPDVPASTIDTPSGKRAITEPLVDAIVVPTSRSAEDLRPAALLAAKARCHLIAVYTDRPPAGFSGVLDGLRPGHVTVLTVRSGIRNHLLDLGASLPQDHVSPAALDISRKRNLGVLLGRLCGWTRILFLDDDIRKLNVAKLSSAAALLDDYPVVGLQVRKFPDASVVGHARRLTGRRQEPFVSGGSLLINPQVLGGYFAPVYHEDWLCVINHLREGTVAIGGTVGQVPYPPFADPGRAEREEFGDILLSGLLWLIHSRKKGAPDLAHLPANDEYWREATDPGFWERILEERAATLQDAITRLAPKAFYTTSPLPSLAAAKQRLIELKPTDFVSFTEEWLTSLSQWSAGPSVRSRVDQVDKARAIEKALANLGLAHIVHMHEVSSQPAPARGTGWVGGFADRWNRWTGTDSRRRFGG
jgi:hypothetical protein